MFTKILVPVDGSAPSDAAVDLAIRLASESEALVVFIHAVELAKIMAMSGPASIDPALTINAACEAGQAILNKAKYSAAQAAVRAIGELLEDQCVGSVIEAARQHKAISSFLAATAGVELPARCWAASRRVFCGARPFRCSHAMRQH